MSVPFEVRGVFKVFFLNGRNVFSVVENSHKMSKLS